MRLSRLELQQMLREMNVKFHADESYESLKQRLQEENHRLWLESISANRQPDDGTTGTVVKKRRRQSPPAGDQESAAAGPASSPSDTPPSDRMSRRRPQSESAYRPPIEKPAPGKPWKAVADGTEPFNRKKHVFDSVLQRAKLCCERCGLNPTDEPGNLQLVPFYILPLSQGGEHSIKNVVALCPSCREILEEAPLAKELKELKRRTRSKLYDALQVVRKRPSRPRRPFAAKQKR